MAKIRIDLNEPFLDGMDIKFKAPCNCTAVDGMIVYYELPDESGVGSQTFTFRDTHGNNLAGLGNLFTEGALVKVIVDRTTSYAYIQNADTNKYLEDKFANVNVSSNGTPSGVSSQAGGLEITGNTLKYIKIGNLVNLQGQVSVKSTTGSANNQQVSFLVHNVPIPPSGMRITVVTTLSNDDTTARCIGHAYASGSSLWVYGGEHTNPTKCWVSITYQVNE